MRLEANSQSLHKSITILCIYCICVCVLFSVASPPLLLVGIIRVSASLPRSSHATRRPAVGAASRLSNENTTHTGRVSKLCIYTIFYLGWVGVSSRTGHHHDHHRIPPHLYIYLYICINATPRDDTTPSTIFPYICIYMHQRNATPPHHATTRRAAHHKMYLIYISKKTTPRWRRPSPSSPASRAARSSPCSLHGANTRLYMVG
jgi:hypothetical protein